jgi:hypothetical protein
MKQRATPSAIQILVGRKDLQIVEKYNLKSKHYRLQESRKASRDF